MRGNNIGVYAPGNIKKQQKLTVNVKSIIKVLN